MLAKMISYYPDRKQKTEDPCVVSFNGDDSEILVSYDDDTRPEGRADWNGKIVGPGHYYVSMGPRSWGTLHRSPAKPMTLEGTWSQEGYTGMWTIDLDEG